MKRTLALTQVMIGAALLTSFLATGQTISTPADHAGSIIDKALQARNADTRKQAVRALSMVGSQEQFASRLESMLGDKDMQVRLAAVASLAESKDAPALRKALDDSTPEVRFAAAKALFTMNDPAGSEALIRVLNGDSKAASGFIATQRRDALHTMQAPKPMLMAGLHAGTAFSPVPGLGAGVKMAEKAMSNPGASNRAAIALLLGKKKDPEAVAAIEHALADKNASVRAAAARSIAMKGDAALRSELVPLLDDKNETVRLQAAAGVLRLDNVQMTGTDEE